MDKLQNTLNEYEQKQWELYLNHYNVGKEIMSEIPRGALFVDYNFRVNANGITFEDKYPKNLSLEAMNRYGDFSVGDSFVLKLLDGQLVFEKQ